MMLMLAAVAAPPDAPPEIELVADADGYLIPGMPPGPKPPADQVQPIAYEIGLKLRCPVCQGMSVADSTSPAAVNMQNRIRELVAAGYDEDQINDFFVERYGGWILLSPQKTGLNLIVWIGPALVAGFGLAMAASTVMQWRKEEDPVPLPSDVGLAPRDKYEARLLAELEDT